MSRRCYRYLISRLPIAIRVLILLPGTRAVSYIIYLTDEDDEEWTQADGGALELFPLVDGRLGEPAFNPSASLLPRFNSMAMFTVLPGRSFHSVQEVFSENKPRLSISGWYHRGNFTIVVLRLLW